jgi:flagellar hook-length control protein FliK
MTPSPVSNVATVSGASPASVVGGSTPGDFAQRLAQQRASPPAPEPARRPAQGGTSGSHGAGGHASAKAADHSKASATNTAGPKTRQTEGRAEAGTADEVDRADAADRRETEDTATDATTDATLDALLSRLAGADAAPATPTPAAVAATLGGLLSRARRLPGEGASDTTTAASAEEVVDSPRLGRGGQRLAHDGLPAGLPGTDSTPGGAHTRAAPGGDPVLGGAAAGQPPATDALAAPDTRGLQAGDASARDAEAVVDTLAAGPGAKGPGSTSELSGTVGGNIAGNTTLAAAALSPAANAAAGASASTSPLPEARLPAHPGHADFAPQLGAQISLFVRDGVQQARLQLNPAEMGPITVQIRLDGGAAQVHMAAENALTRQALEQAMPTLASSLRDGGHTLTGGGVFEQPGQASQGGADPQDQARAGHHPGAASDSGSGRDTLTTALPAPMRRGVVDLVA